MFGNRILTRNPFAALFNRTLPEPTPEEQLAAKLAERKAVRIAEQNRARDAYWKAERKRRENDPLLRGAAGLTASVPSSPEGHCPNSALPAFDL